MGTPRENKRFREFREDVIRHGTIIDNNTLTILISRHTQGNMGRRFFREDLKLRYYNFWIKRLHRSGTLTETDKWGVWKINEQE